VTDGNGSSGSDPIGDFQRWLVRSSAKSLSRELKDQFRRAAGGSSQGRADVWETATTEPPPTPGEPPECAWCPICRAARRARQSGPGLASQVAGAGDALFGIAQDALSAVEATLSARPPAPSATQPPAAVRPPGAPAAQAAAPGTEHRKHEGTGWPGEDVGRPASPPQAQRAAPGGPDHRS
jgi:hypothetical protein